MTAATITQAHKGSRHQISALAGSVRAFATELFAAHGGWLAPASKSKFLNAKPHGAAAGMSAMEAGVEATAAGIHALAKGAEAHSPSLAIELRFIASRG